MTTNMTTVEQHRYLFENQLKHAMPFGCHFIGTFANESCASSISTPFTSSDLTGDKSFHKWATTTGALNQLRLVPGLNGSSGWNHICLHVAHETEDVQVQESGPSTKDFSTGLSLQ